MDSNSQRIKDNTVGVGSYFIEYIDPVTQEKIRVRGQIRISRAKAIGLFGGLGGLGVAAGALLYALYSEVEEMDRLNAQIAEDYQRSIEKRDKLTKVVQEIEKVMDQGLNEPLFMNGQMGFDGRAVLELSNRSCEPLPDEVVSEFKNEAKSSAKENGLKANNFEKFYDSVADCGDEMPLNAARIHF